MYEMHLGTGHFKNQITTITVPLPGRTLFERTQFCKRSFKVMDFSSLRVINWFRSVSRVITILQFIPDFGLDKVDISDVDSDFQAQRLYAVACLTLLNCKPPKDISGQLLEIFSGVLWETERQSYHGRLKVTDSADNS